MELKAVPARYEHASQLAKYKQALERAGEAYVIMWLVAPLIPKPVRDFMDQIGIEYTEIHEAEYRAVAQRHGIFFESETHKPAIAVPQRSSTPSRLGAPATSSDGNGPELEELRRLFLEQTERFRAQVKASDAKAHFRMTYSLPSNGKNWFITFYPGEWGYPSSEAGVHWELYSTQRSNRPSALLILHIGVEKPLDPQYKNDFMRAVVSDARSTNSVPAGFTLFGERPGQRKLLSSTSLPLDASTAMTAYSIYSEAVRFNALVARRVREFDAAHRFLSSLGYS